jgi:hypothetical protein
MPTPRPTPSGRDLAVDYGYPLDEARAQTLLNQARSAALSSQGR